MQPAPSETIPVRPVERNRRIGQPFDEVLADVHARADLAYPNAVLSLARLHVTDQGAIEVPGVGALALTDWSRAQLSRLLGVKWTRWFDDALVSPAERADEINRRLSRHPAEMKIRARRYDTGEVGVADGLLRAFVSPGYQPIDDVRAFDRLAKVLGPRASDFRFARVEQTDRGSYYVAVTAGEVDLGNGTPDLHRPGFHLVNSEVGAAALRIFEYVLRLVCSNGLVMRVAEKLFYRVHRKTEDESIDRDLAYALSLLPERWDRSTRLLRGARHDAVAEPERVLREMLAADPQAKPLTDAVLGAYRQESDPTRFGLVQAITRAAQNVAPEARLALETLAGTFLAEEQVA